MKEYHILNLGAGVQSTTLSLLVLSGEIAKWCPTFDAAIFADTQEEPHTVYEHLAWLRTQTDAHWPTLIRTRGKLGDQLVRGVNANGQRFVSIPAFTTDHEGNAKEAGRLRRQCTKEYKSDVINQTIRREILGLKPRRHIPSNVIIHQYLGLSFEEYGRIFGTAGSPGAKARIEAISRVRAHFPLYELFLTRETCLAYLSTQNIPHKVPRSACLFCPYHGDREWLNIKTSDPEGWQRVVQVDGAIRNHDSVCTQGMQHSLFLHRSCLPISKVQFTRAERPDQQERNFAALECEGMCGV